MFVAHWFAHAIEHRRRHFVRSHEAMDFAERKTTKNGVVRVHVPAEARNLIGTLTTLKAWAMMHQIERNPTTGKIIAKRFTLEEIEEASANNYGLYLACGAERERCEPNARKYRCDACNHDTVYGADEVALMGLLK